MNKIVIQQIKNNKNNLTDLNRQQRKIETIYNQITHN